MTAAASGALISNDIIVFGLIAATLGAIFWTSTSSNRLLKKFYGFVPALLLCYFIPGIYNTFGLIDGETTRLYNPIARDVFLPAALVLLTLSIDLKGILGLGWKMLAMYVAAVLSIMFGAVVAFWLMGFIHPETVTGGTWGGMAALAGSWIGGGANMLAMKEIFEVDATTFGQFAVVDVGVGYVWMAVLIFFASRAPAMDRRSGADTTALDELRDRVASYQAQHARIPALGDLMVMAGVAFGAVAISHALAGPLSGWFGAHFSWSSSVSLDKPFVWVVLLATFIGLGLSFTRARELEGVGASKWGSMFLYFLIAASACRWTCWRCWRSPGCSCSACCGSACTSYCCGWPASCCACRSSISPSPRRATSAARPRRRCWPRRSTRRWRRWACCWARWAMRWARARPTWSASPCGRWPARGNSAP